MHRFDVLLVKSVCYLYITYNITQAKKRAQAFDTSMFVLSRSAIGFRFWTIVIYDRIKPLNAAKTYLYVF